MNRYGFVLASLLITTTLIVLIGTAVAQVVVSNFKQATAEVYRLDSQLAADAGLDYGIVQLNLSNSWGGTGAEVELYNDGGKRTTFEVTIYNGSSSLEKFAQSTGRVYEPASSTTPRQERTYELDLRGLQTGGMFSVVTGVGGLRMSNNAKIVAGDVYVNGDIILENSAQIGLTTNGVTVRAAHQSCPNPPDVNYPWICQIGENGEPITMSVNARIYGNVKANNQTTSTHMSNPGLASNILVGDRTCTNCGYIAVEPLPPHDRMAQINAVSTNLTGEAASCTTNNGTKTWQANTKITGNVTINKDCRVTILGNVWITGSIAMTQSGIIKTAEGITDEPTIMIDSVNGLNMRNSTRLTANASHGIGIQVVTYYSTLACSISTTAPCDVAGSDLYNSRNIATIDLDQSAAGPESILYSKWSKVLINNSGDIGALVGQTVELRNSGAITFGTAVPGPSPTITWLVDTYRRVF